jgi:hypothetical protein
MEIESLGSQVCDVPPSLHHDHLLCTITRFVPGTETDRKRLLML